MDASSVSIDNSPNRATGGVSNPPSQINVQGHTLSASQERENDQNQQQQRRTVEQCSVTPVSEYYEAIPSQEPPMLSGWEPTRHPKNKTPKAAHRDLDIGPDRELEYEDPSGDFSLGRVFIHPSSRATQACVRCNRSKRKCNYTWPRCTACVRANAPCVFELNAATSNYVRKLKATNADLASQLTNVESTQRVPSTLYSRDEFLATTNAVKQALMPSVGDFTGLASSILNIGHATGLPSIPPLNPSTSSISPPEQEEQASPIFPTPPLSELLDYDVAIRAAGTYFDFNTVSYPFLDRKKYLEELDEAYCKLPDSGVNHTMPDYANFLRAGIEHNRVSVDGIESRIACRKRFIVLMVLAVGLANGERLGEVHKGLSGFILKRAFRYRSIALGSEDMLCLQSLMLLAIYAMFDPSSSSLWQVVGFAGRIAMSLSLHRRVELSPLLTGELAEHRRRVFYAFYNLDRHVSVTLSMPPTIADDDIDIEMPSARPGERTYHGVPETEAFVHHVKIRRLLSNILTTTFSASGTQNLQPEHVRQSIISSLHHRLDSWVSECPMPLTDDEIGRGIVRHTWFYIYYNFGLCLLYRPSPLYPSPTTMMLRTLYEASTRCVELYLELWQENKVVFNVIQASNQYVVCTSVLYCLSEYDARMRSLGATGLNVPPRGRALMNALGLAKYMSADDPAWHDEIQSRISKCQQLLHAYDHAIPALATFRDSFSTLSDLLFPSVANSDPFFTTLSTFPPSASSSHFSITPGSSVWPSTSTPQPKTDTTCNEETATPIPDLPSDGCEMFSQVETGIGAEMQATAGTGWTPIP